MRRTCLFSLCACTVGFGSFAWFFVRCAGVPRDAALRLEPLAGGAPHTPFTASQAFLVARMRSFIRRLHFTCRMLFICLTSFGEFVE
eukprot:6206288-Pleurochrysis_carterae.AAC.5